ncbi:hypothetical protein RUM44_005393 [Polyplax serrata]|uniref:C2H2-type domain-containing protein n=1 Tax=Polyplax serrata TaxID=468196 RepID=A0ABR1ADF4_POLSC
MEKPRAEKMSDVQKASYLEAYMAQQAAALQQQQNKFRYDNIPLSMEDKKKSIPNGNPISSPPKIFPNSIGGCANYAAPIKVPQLQTTTADTYKPNLESTFTVPDDGLGYDDGVRVLRTLGSWTPEYPGLSSRPTSGMLFPDLPYPHTDMAINQRKLTPSVLPSPLPVPQSHNTSPLTRPTPTLPQMKKDDMGLNNANSRNQQNTQQPQQPQQPQQQTPLSRSNSQPKTNGISVQNSGSKSFTCTICGKSLARKDKLVIHTRIHTGEKPYICEVCDKAFARRDKLVIHMNKMKHRTPTNIAPLGKRTNIDKNSAAKKALQEDMEEIPKATALSIQSAAANWSCELCGQMMTTREEWTVHAKAHLEEKITGIGVISPNNFPNNQRPIANYGANSVHMAGIGNPTYPAVPQHSSHYQPFSITERQYCPVCRQTFATKSEFMLHVRAHFDNVIKPHEVDSVRQSQVHPSGTAIIDNASICS